MFVVADLGQDAGGRHDHDQPHPAEEDDRGQEPQVETRPPRGPGSGSDFALGGGHVLDQLLHHLAGRHIAALVRSS